MSEPLLSPTTASRRIKSIRELDERPGWRLFIESMERLRETLVQTALQDHDPAKREEARHQANLLKEEILTWAESNTAALEKVVQVSDRLE